MRSFHCCSDGFSKESDTKKETKERKGDKKNIYIYMKEQTEKKEKKEKKDEKRKEKKKTMSR